MQVPRLDLARSSLCCTIDPHAKCKYVMDADMPSLFTKLQFLCAYKQLCILVPVLFICSFSLHSNKLTRCASMFVPVCQLARLTDHR